MTTKHPRRLDTPTYHAARRIVDRVLEELGDRSGLLDIHDLDRPTRFDIERSCRRIAAEEIAKLALPTPEAR